MIHGIIRTYLQVPGVRYKPNAIKLGKKRVYKNRLEKDLHLQDPSPVL